jgi:HSP20 family protein
VNIILRRNNGGKPLVPFYRTGRLPGEIDSLAREIWDGWRPPQLEQVLVPHTDIYEGKDELVMKTELPGIDKKDLDITIEGDWLTIKAEKMEEVQEEVTHHTRERRYGHYLRSMTLPYPVDEAKISATLDNGVLELRLPKAEEAKVKKIEIKAQLPEGESKKKVLKPDKEKS